MKNSDIAKTAPWRQIGRKKIPLAGNAAVRVSPLHHGQLLPLVISPDNIELDLAAWASSNRGMIEENRRLHGGVLFRGFRVKSPQEFQAAAEVMCNHLFSEYGDLARQEVSDKIYGSTVYPADKEIRFHNESSHLHQWPLKIIFYCAQAATRGGETPILDSRRIAGLLKEPTRTKLKHQGIRYVRNFGEGLDVSWRQFFRTDQRVEVEAQCREAGLGFQWGRRDSLRTWKVCPAFRVHPETGEEVFFNQLLIHHPAGLDSEVRHALLRLFSEEGLPRDARYGDGSQIEDDVVQEVMDASKQAATSFPWHEGDVLLLDNMLTAHSRSPYAGERKILVALGEMIAESDRFIPNEVSGHEL